MNTKIVPVAMLKKFIVMGKCKITVQGNSMEPTLMEGDEVEVVQADTLNIDDIILVHQNGRNVVHRVVAMGEGFTITKGDNNRYMDYVITNDCVLGKVQNVLPGRFKPSSHRILYNFWDEKHYEACACFATELKLEMVNKPGWFMDNALNVAISPYAMRKLSDIKNKCSYESNICIHIGAKVSDFLIEGFILDEHFDEVCRAASVTSSHILNQRDNFLVLYGQILSFMKEWEDK